MEQPPSSSSVEPPSAEDRLFSALAYPYWYVAFPVFMLSARQQKSEYLRYHMFQGLVLGLALFWGGVSLWTLGAVIGRLGLFGLLLYPILKLAEWVGFGVVVYATVSAWLGKRCQIPFVTEFVRPLLHERSTP